MNANMKNAAAAIVTLDIAAASKKTLLAALREKNAKISSKSKIADLRDYAAKVQSIYSMCADAQFSQHTVKTVDAQIEETRRVVAARVAKTAQRAAAAADKKAQRAAKSHAVNVAHVDRIIAAAVEINEKTLSVEIAQVADLPKSSYTHRAIFYKSGKLGKLLVERGFSISAKRDAQKRVTLTLTRVAAS